jgi:hypothetical protein
MGQWLWDEGLNTMTAWKRAIELSLEDADSAKLRSIAQARTEPASRVERARIRLAYREDPSFFAVGRRLGLHHQTVQRCVERALAYGPIAALDDRARPGKDPKITPEAKAWLVSRGQRNGESAASRELDRDDDGGPIAAPFLQSNPPHGTERSRRRRYVAALQQRALQ